MPLFLLVDLNHIFSSTKICIPDLDALRHICENINIFIYLLRTDMRCNYYTTQKHMFQSIFP